MIGTFASCRISSTPLISIHKNTAVEQGNKICIYRIVLSRLVTLQPPATLGGTMTPRVNCPAGTCPPRHLAAAVVGRMMPAVSAAQTGAPDNHPLGGINMTGIMQGS